MKTFDYLKPLFITSIFLSGIFIMSCKKSDADPYQNAYQLKSGTGSVQATALATGCGGSSLKDHFISLSYGYAMINNYQAATKRADGVCTIFDQGGWVMAESFPAEAIQTLLNQKGCCKLRVYNGVDSDNRLHLVMVGVNEKGVDVFYCNRRTDSAGGTGMSSDSCVNMDNLGLIVEMGAPCPESCSGVYTGGQ